MKIFYKLLKSWGQALSLIIYLQQTYWEYGRRGGFTSHAGVLLPSEVLSQYRCLPKTTDNDRALKNLKGSNTLS